MVFGIGNTAEYGTSGLDDGQAARLLSAVSGYGLPVVEPGPIPDPVAAGLNTAINHAYHAWIRTQPQLILELWPRDGLDETQTSALCLVEPAGFTSGAEPRRVSEAHRTSRAAPPATPNAGGSAPLSYEGRDALPSKSARPGQGGSV